MSLCDECVGAAEENRWELDATAREDEPEPWFVEHPTNCGCPCQHRMPEQWAKQFSTEQPHG